MKYARMIKSIGPVKFILLFLFIFLPALEFSDGILGVGDLCAFFLLALLVNDIFLANRSFFLGSHRDFFGSSNPPQIDFSLRNLHFKECDSIKYCGAVKMQNLLFTNNKSMAISNLIHRVDVKEIDSKGEDPKWLTFRMVERKSVQKMMNFIFFIIVFLPALLDYYGIHQSEQFKLFLIGMMIWSVVLLGVSFKSIKKEKKIYTLITCHIAIVVLVISGLILF